MAHSKTEPKEGWWFSGGDTLPHGDNRPIVIGERIGVKGKLVICQNALHGSFDPFDALQYAPGPYLHKVLFSGARIEESDKLGSRYRTVLARRDATSMLRQFACEQALSVIHLWDAPAIVRDYLETRDESKRIAAWEAAAEAAAWAAAAWDAAWDAAARAAAWAAAARDAAAWAAAWAAARDAAGAAARLRFNELVNELFAQEL